MTRYKTTELTGRLLDAAFAKAEGVALQYIGTSHQSPVGWRTDPQGEPLPWAPHKDGLIFDPIIEREGIATWKSKAGWGAEHPANPEGYYCLESGILDTSMMRRPTGADRLTAAMRAFVVAELGDEVDL